MYTTEKLNSRKKLILNLSKKKVFNKFTFFYFRWPFTAHCYWCM